MALDVTARHAEWSRNPPASWPCRGRSGEQAPWLRLQAAKRGPWPQLPSKHGSPPRRSPTHHHTRIGPPQPAPAHLQLAAAHVQQAGHAKVGDLQHTVPPNQDVGGLDVAVDDA